MQSIHETSVSVEAISFSYWVEQKSISFLKQYPPKNYGGGGEDKLMKDW